MRGRWLFPVHHAVSTREELTVRETQLRNKLRKKKTKNKTSHHNNLGTLAATFCFSGNDPKTALPL